MALQTIAGPPRLEDFTPLAEHQAATPDTFFGAKPVLYLHVSNATLQIDRRRLSEQAAFTPFAGAATGREPSGNAVDGDAVSNGDDSAGEGCATSATEQPAFIPHTEVYVTSHTLIFWNARTAHGLEIPYPSICMHAVNAGRVYVQLVLFQSGPDAATTTATATATATPDREADPQDDAVSDVEVLEFHILPPADAGALYDAIAKCSALNPDPKDGAGDGGEGGAGDEDGLGGRFAFGDTDGAPGAGGWITAENMDQFVDADGNFRIPDGDGIDGVPGDHGPAEADDSVDGDEGRATKWRRTG